jgi:hypothetical protein
MSAGSGVLHSEFNASSEEPVHFLQIWFFTDKKGVQPSYEQKTFSREDKLGRLRLIASPDGREGSVSIHQNAFVYAAVLEKGYILPVSITENRHLWIQVARGKVKLGDITLTAGDGAAVSNETTIPLTGVDDTEILVFDLA